MQTLEVLKKELHAHVASVGGWYEIGESDDTLNDLNRKQIVAFKAKHGTAYLGKINYYDAERKQITSGSKSVYTEYTGQMVYNFEFAFCVPCLDEKLESMIRDWNGTGQSVDAYKNVCAITAHIEKIGGIQFIWS